MSSPTGDGSTNTVLSLLNSALSLFYPQSCGICGADGEVLCANCINKFRVIKESEVCPVCGKWLGRRILCGSCSLSEMWFSRGLFGFEYDGAIREAIHAFKFDGCKAIFRQLGQMVCEKVLALKSGIDLTVPVPVSARRLGERGFNQSYVIAEEISALPGSAIDHSALVKKDDVRDQRKKNIKDAFRVKRPQNVKGRLILLVDDLFATGYTASEASRTLIQTGSAEVVLFALARTP